MFQEIKETFGMATHQYEVLFHHFQEVKMPHREIKSLHQKSEGLTHSSSSLPLDKRFLKIQ